MTSVGFIRAAVAGAFGIGATDRPIDDLVVRLRDGNVAALGEAYNRYHAQARGLARRLVGDNAAAEDLVQEVFLALPRAIQRYRGESALGTFVLSIVVNHARHHVRSAARRRRMLEEVSGHPRPSVADPEHSATRRETAMALTSALDELPIDERVAFVLCEVEERSSAEAAKILGVPDATVRTRLFRARRTLRGVLDGAAL